MFRFYMCASDSCPSYAMLPASASAIPSRTSKECEKDLAAPQRAAKAALAQKKEKLKKKEEKHVYARSVGNDHLKHAVKK